MKKVLYITYDGLTDPLGQSQILPYLKGLTRYGYEFTILSFEKRSRYQKDKTVIEKLNGESGIRWVPLRFNSKPPLISKFYDALQMQKKAVELQKKYSFDMIHCRSYIAADVGIYLKKKFGVKFLFDMRGFWADEKKDGGSWNMSNPIFRLVYSYYKRREAQYLQLADYIISLTEAGKQEMQQWNSYNKEIAIAVIPCCADMNLFSLTTPEQKRASRENLGLDNDALVLSYLGSVGAWYMLDEMLQFFRQTKQRYPNARFLFVTHTPRSIIDQAIQRTGLRSEDFIITQASRNEVPLLIKASDINLSFIRPVYSKLSSSPTKLGEVLSMGIPVICNGRVGDVEKIVTTTNAGIVIHEFSERDFEKAIKCIPELLNKSPEAIRHAIENIYSLNKGIDLYASCYDQIF
ncbi:MAG TPA: glycosyltransferase [Chitinophagaceae bacterium]|jgi:glycosyltransferase involved in cell wall biosynthesis|nr:glycosyltransferase [Chitinophagaceae bacterium]